jgi:regulator of nonsense transcripts 2
VALDYSRIQIGDRAPSPDPVVVLSAQDNLGPSEEAEAEFAKELAKMVTDSSAEARKLGGKTALALLDSTILPPGIRKKRVNENDGEDGGSESEVRNTMSFTVITKRGNKQQVRGIFIASFVHSHFVSLSDSSTCRSCCICACCSHSLCPITR